MLGLLKTATFLIFFNLYCYAAYFGTPMQYGTTVFSALAIFFMLAEILTTTKINVTLKTLFPTEIIWWFAFIIVAAVGSIIFAADKTYAINALIQFGEKLIFAILIIYICIRDDSADFPLNMILIISTIAAIVVIFNSNSLNDRLALSDNANPNKLGNMMLFGVFCSIYHAREKAKPKQLLALAICILLTVVLILSGSRKSLYALLLMLFLFCLIAVINGKLHINAKDAIWAVVIIPIIVIVGIKLWPILKNSAMYERVLGRLAERAADSDNVRLSLYQKAFHDWLDSPFFGNGFMSFFVQHGSYTHSTYAEVLTCCGLFGVITYFTPYVLIAKKLKAKLCNLPFKSPERIQAEYIVILSIIYLFVGIGVGQMYDNLSFLEFGAILGYIYVGSRYNSRGFIRKDAIINEQKRN